VPLDNGPIKLRDATIIYSTTIIRKSIVCSRYCHYKHISPTSKSNLYNYHGSCTLIVRARLNCRRTFAMDSPVASSNALHLTIRFTTSIPDLHLDIADPKHTTVIALKHLLRSRLEAPTSQHRLRFIHGGKLLKDDDILYAVLKVPAPPPRAPDPKGRGKAVEPLLQRVYINCSIGDALTPSELSDLAIERAKDLKMTPNATIPPDLPWPLPYLLSEVLTGCFLVALQPPK
jgi:hypothetical protein